MTNPYIMASTVLLLRDSPNFEVLMIERHADISFAGGALVFPGGKLTECDHNPAWSDHISGFDDIPEEERAPRIAAIREAFEETGILLARPHDDAALIDDTIVSELQDHRAAIEADSALFIEMIIERQLVLALDGLVKFARWRPPVEATHKRFDTWFFAAVAPAGQTAYEDGNEATEVMWINPQDAIAARDAGTRHMIFPTIRNVELLNQRRTTDETLAYAGERTFEIIQPTMAERDGRMYICIPEGLGYPVTEESIDTAFRR